MRLQRNAIAMQCDGRREGRRREGGRREGGRMGRKDGAEGGGKEDGWREDGGGSIAIALHFNRIALHCNRIELQPHCVALQSHCIGIALHRVAITFNCNLPPPPSSPLLPASLLLHASCDCQNIVKNNGNASWSHETCDTTKKTKKKPKKPVTLPKKTKIKGFRTSHSWRALLGSGAGVGGGRKPFDFLCFV